MLAARVPVLLVYIWPRLSRVPAVSPWGTRPLSRPFDFNRAIWPHVKHPVKQKDVFCHFWGFYHFVGFTVEEGPAAVRFDAGGDYFAFD